MIELLLKFPKDFMWGSSASALQTEGYGTTLKAKSVWNKLYEQNPGSFYGQASPDQGVDAMRHYKEDIALMTAYGHNSFRSGFSWCRLFPDGKTVNKEAVAYYHEYLREAKKHGLKRVMTLQHFEMPLWISEKGGYAWKDFPSYFLTYCDFIFSEFGSEVEIFAIYNEPNVEVVFGYILGYFPPKLKDNQLGIKAWKGVIISNAMACDLFNTKYRAKCNAKLAAVHAVHMTLPKDGKSYTKADEKAAEKMNALTNYSFLDAMILGRVAPEFESLLAEKGLSHGLTKTELAILAKSKVDCVGMNYYSVQRMVARGTKDKPGDLLTDVGKPYVYKEARFNPFRGWEIYPAGLSILAGWIKNRYGNIPYFISENGMAVQEEWKFLDKKGVVQDDYRIAFLSEHLAQLHKDTAEGANCIGYHMWSTTDCWSMFNGHKNTYGFFRVDIPTMKRYPKKSAFWFKDVLKNNGVEDKFKKVEQVIDLKVKVIPSAFSSISVKTSKS